MNKTHLPVLSRCSLFSGIEAAETEKLLVCLNARTGKYEKGTFIFMEDEEPLFLGIVLEGSVHVVRDDFWGNRTIVERFGPADVFAEAFPLGEIRRLPAGVMAAEKSEILFLNCKKITGTCSAGCSFHLQLIRNMIRDLAGKNILLVRKMEFITRKTTREKLLAYLSSQARQVKSNVFDIPFNRQELADYLSVDRSAMSAELCRMRDEGLIKFKRSGFEILKRPHPAVRGEVYSLRLSRKEQL